MEAISPDSPSAFVQLLVNAAMSGRWPLLVALALVGIVWLLRKLVAPKVPFFATGEGGAVMNLATSFTLALATALLPGAAFTWSLLWVALQASLVASGGWSLLKYLLPLIPGLSGLMARGDATAIEADAKAAGDVAAKAAAIKTATDIINKP